VGIDVSQAGDTSRISLDIGSDIPSYEVKRLSNPPRLVIDLTSHRVKTSKNLAIADLDLVDGIRIGAHPKSGRVVMDLADGQDVEHNVRVESGKIIVSLSPSKPTLQGKVAARSAQPSPNVGASPKAGAAVIPAKVEPRLPDADSEAPSPKNKVPQVANAVVSASLGESAKQAIPAQRDARTEEPKKKASEKAQPPVIHPAQDVSVLPVSANTTGKRVNVTSVRLNSAGPSSSVIAIDVDSAPEFVIERTAPSEYVLTLKNAALPDSALSSTLFSESQTASIRSVRSASRGTDALIRIFARPDIYLTARVAGSQVVVEETKDLRQVVDDMRAQLAPKDAKSPPPSGKPKDSSVAAKSKDVVEDLSEAELEALRGDTARYTGKLISLDLQDTDIDNALRIIAEVSNLNIVASEEVVGKVTLRLTDVPWDQALDVILKSHGLDSVQEGNVVRIAPIEKLKTEREALKQARIAENELEELVVKYIRVSYGKASELKSLVETVLSERGTVAYDERSNQLIVKDIQSGIENVTELVAKVDLRTPQVLLETQIVEASRNLTRDLGTELGFQYIQSPATGNGTGLNFPSAISVGGTLGDGIAASAFPAAVSKTGGSAIGMLFDSADGTKSLEVRLTQLETEGRIRIVSRPAVATTNNKAAEIKSVEKYRVRLPSGGTSVATGQGSTANGTGGAATEVIEAGIVLNVTPQASPDYYILLDIKAKSSTFGNSDVEGIPNEIERSASSSVLVSSGQTFALGGIYKLTDKDDVSGVPFLKDIPVFGTFFRRLQTTNADEELLFFITPRIVEGSFDDSSMKAAS
jgi:type IV pilus assembly protein PilQ